MKKVIYYFTGTGNSLRAARRIAEGLGGAELVSVKNEPENFSAASADVIGFLCPVYEWDVPGRMRAFIERLEVNPEAYIFMVATCVGISGRSFETVQALLQAKGASLSYAKMLRCVASQCTAYQPFPPETIMIPRMERGMERIGRDVAARKRREYPRMSPITRALYPKLMQPYMNVEHEYDKGFYTSPACIGCGVCKSVCPLENISLDTGNPVWNHNCHGCMACVVYCPTKAIKYSPPEAYRALGKKLANGLGLPDGRKRYHNPYVKASDLTRSTESVK